MHHLTYAAAQPAEQRAALEAIIRADPALMHILEVMRVLDLPDCWLAAGCIYQTVWNALTGRPAGHGIKDYDISYCDLCDLSWEGEDAVIKRAGPLLGSIAGQVEIRNQARVHLWFPEHFGIAYAPVVSTAEAIARYASICHRVAARLDDAGAIEIHAQGSLADIFAFSIRPNPVLDNAATHARKAARCKALWPELVIIPWSA